jgi:hypothetical protein
MKRSCFWWIKSSALLGLAIVATGTAKADNVVQNGDFSSGSFPPSWTLSGDSSQAFITSGQLTGSAFQAALTTSTDENGFLMQTLNTVSGQNYAFSFLLGGDGATPNSFSASLGGSTLVNLTDIPGNAPTGMMYSVDYTATAASTVVQFTFDDAPGFLYLTDVSVSTIPASVPEPTTFVTVSTGVLMLTGYLWRKRRRSTTA